MRNIRVVLATWAWYRVTITGGGWIYIIYDVDVKLNDKSRAMKFTYPSWWCESVSRIAIEKLRSGEYVTDRTRIPIQDLENIWYM